MSSPSKQPFINTAAVSNSTVEGSSSPFHAMEEENDEGHGISMVPVDPSTFDEFDEENDLKVYHGHADFDPNDINIAFIAKSSPLEY